MANAMVKLIVGFFASIATQKFFNRVANEVIYYLSQLTETKVDDKLSMAVSEAVELPWPGHKDG